MNIPRLVTAVLIAATYGSTVHAAVSAEEAAKLGTTLTVFGADAAASTDGQIPAYTGGVTKAPAEFKPDSGKWVDPFAGEKPTMTITAQNWQEYSDKLSESSKELFKRFPDYKMVVYPTHRSASFPDWYGENCKINAVQAKLTNGGQDIEGAFGCIPFPIAKTGEEALWNYIMRFVGTKQKNFVNTWLMDSSGNPVLTGSFKSSIYFPYYDPALGREGFKKSDGVWYQVMNDYAAPARLKGETSLFWDYTASSRDWPGWSYSPGQRRTRVAPDLAYDTPNPGYSGVITMDDIQLMYGKLDRWKVKMLGTKEMYIPYNGYKWQYATSDKDMLTPHFPNANLIRWELHRVRVLELTLKPGARHLYSKKILYTDEDLGGGMMDAYDQAGKLYRGGFADTVPAYDVKVPYSLGNWFFDFNSGVYLLGSHPADTSGIFFNVDFPNGFFTPERMQSTGIR
ncbi:DUF1329 domain-containing protein [Paraburkholderia nemoris]|uniref:DUF1329 domain-containing protein n=1 Tax=Paraburkholderia nemoris TaxID=2793076 RepID=UPI0038B88687